MEDKDKSVIHEINEDAAKITDEETEINQNTEEDLDVNTTIEENVMELRKKLDEKQKEANEYLQMAQRLKAEFENYKKRTDKEKNELIEYGQEKIILEILPVIDNFERALNSEGDLKALKEGIELVYRQFKTILDKCGVKEIDAEGLIFDPYKHHAVMQAEEEGRKENEIIEVFQKGYTLNDKVIRPSMVKVAK